MRSDLLQRSCYVVAYQVILGSSSGSRPLAPRPCRDTGHPALGEPVVAESRLPCYRVGWRLMRQPPTSARRIASVDELDRLARFPGVNTVVLDRTPEDPVDWREGTGDFLYEATGVSADHEGLPTIVR